ncbi:NmrA family NAD(P)-binding protein [Edaphobacter sp. HDX4]|uniref:NmrA family NAD(P)-binding protein n=1 Tax=Edaphobacter sp. HDX4 TaxID=2794064 RepID=UPI002FE5A44A
MNDASAVANALEGIDTAFYIAPVEIENEAETGKQFVALAKNAGVRRIVFSSVIHPILSELPNHAGKAPVEEAILDSDLEYVLLHPAVFFQNLKSAWPKVKETGVHGEPWSNDTRFSRVDYRDVAEVAAIAPTEDRLLFGTFELCADGVLNRYDIAALMSDVLGRIVTAKKIDPPSEGGNAKLARMFAWYDKHPLLGNATTLRAILGREPRTLQAFLQDLNGGH